MLSSFIHQSPGEVYRTNCITKNKLIPSLIFGAFFYPVNTELSWSFLIKTWVSCRLWKLKPEAGSSVRKDSAILCVLFHWRYGKFQADWQEMQQWTHPQFSVASTERQKVAKKDLYWVYSMGYIFEHLTNPFHTLKLQVNIASSVSAFVVNFHTFFASYPCHSCAVHSSCPACWCGLSAFRNSAIHCMTELSVTTPLVLSNLILVCNKWWSFVLELPFSWFLLMHLIPFLLLVSGGLNVFNTFIFLSTPQRWEQSYLSGKNGVT